MDTLYKNCTLDKCNCQLLEVECKQWVQLLLQLVDVGGDHSVVHLQRFLGSSTLAVVKKYRADIIKDVSTAGISLEADGLSLGVQHLRDAISLFQVHDQTHAKFPELPVHKFFPLYKAFVIWPSEVSPIT